MFKNVYSLYSAFFTQPAFYSQSAVCILHSVCILPLVRSLQSAVRTVRFTLTAVTVNIEPLFRHAFACSLYLCVVMSKQRNKSASRKQDCTSKSIPHPIMELIGFYFIWYAFGISR